ncbi:efflux RND transporter periplasmic adaptor subunit [Pendulispora albinea]|uniref:Efflux RND transporter periplasmic adaptor subunit n=1 Tax=Pendulispora albinea TaxID=2741071 RepID=A0ABZ2M574_9BACT
MRPLALARIVASSRWVFAGRVLRILCAVCLIGLACAACHRKEEGADGAKGIIPVKVRSVDVAAEVRGARYSGSIEPATRVDLAFKVGGYIRDLLQVKDSDGKLRKVQEGDFVRAGTVLASVRESDYQQQLAQTNAQLAQAQANQKQAQLDFDRVQKLVASNAIAPAELDAMTAKLATAKAMVQGAQAQVGNAQLVLGDTTLRAPIDGVILKRGVEAGTFVAPGTVGFVLADTKKVKFVFGAPDTLIEKLKIGSNLGIHVDATQADFEGTITRIAPSADPKSRVFEVEITIPNPKDALRVGMVASLKVPDGAIAETALSLPLTAIVRSPADPRGFAVYVVAKDGDHDVAKVRDVGLGDVLGNGVQVTSGLKRGEQVVSMGATLLVDGSRIRILP